MSERVTANLPARDFDRTKALYRRLGFRRVFRDDGWMILARGSSWVEFFSHTKLDPRTSWFSACLRTEDLDGLFTDFQALGLSDARGSIPRLTPPVLQSGAPRLFALVDENGTLWRCVEE